MGIAFAYRCNGWCEGFPSGTVCEGRSQPGGDPKRQDPLRLGFRVILLCAAVILSCSSTEKPVVIAKIGPVIVTSADLKKIYRVQQATSLSSGTNLLGEEEKMILAEELVMHRILLDEAKSGGTEIDPADFEDYLKNLRGGYNRDELASRFKELGGLVDDWESLQKERFLVSRWLSGKSSRKNPVSEQDLVSFYRKNPGKFVEPESVRASHIIVSSSSEAEKLHRRIGRGESFGELAKRFSTGPEAANGGDLGYFTREDYPPLFADRCFSMKVGEVSEIVQSDYGFHIFKVTGRKQKRAKPLGEVKDEIRKMLAEERLQKEVRGELERVRERARSVIDKKSLMEVSL